MAAEELRRVSRLGPARAFRRLGLAALLLALALKAMVPAGWMPGPSLAQPIALCPDGDGDHAMPGLRSAHGGHGDHHAQHGAPDHPCAFAGLGAPTLAAALDPPAPPPPSPADDSLPVGVGAPAPGRGLAAPPPPSHAPPILRA